MSYSNQNEKIKMNKSHNIINFDIQIIYINGSNPQ
jgi:hypothetical protein